MPKLWKLAEKQENIEKIQQLRNQASALLNQNNALVDKLWAIEHQLIDAPNDMHQSLFEQKQQLKNQIQEENYIGQIDKIKQEIYALEVKIYGESEILNTSPSKRNSLL